MPPVGPAGIVGNGIEANPLDRNVDLGGGTDLAGNVTQPGGPSFGLRTGLGDEEWAGIALMNLG